MFEFNRLPTLVKEKVVRFAVDVLYGKQRLKLWSISSEWRQLVLPNLFPTVVLVETQDSHEGMGDINDLWSSDIALINRLHCARFVRRVVIVIQTLEGFHRFAKGFCSLFETDKNTWIRVFTLEMYINTDLESRLRLEDGFTENYQSLRRTANTLAENMFTCMPSVQKLLLNSGTDDSCASLLCSRLGNAYSNRIKVLVSVSRLTFDYLQVFTCLTVLEVQLNSSAAQLLPIVNTALLQSIRLSNASRKFSWNSFAMPGQHTISFDNLASANIDFIEGGETFAKSKSLSKTPQVLLPKLEHLLISDCPPDHQIFENCVLPSQLKMITVFNSFEVLEHLSQVSILDSTDEIYVNLSAAVSNDRMSRVFNQCFGVSATCKDSQLYLNFVARLEFDILDLSTLQSLGFNLIHFADLLYVIANMPELLGLEIDTLDFEDELANGQRFDYAEYLQRPIAPLYSQIHNITIRQFTGQPTRVALVSVKHLVKSLTKLRTFQSLKDVNEDLQLFMLEYKNEYPHLADISIETI